MSVAAFSTVQSLALISTTKITAVRTLECSPGSDPACIAAASGLVKVGDTYWVVADDELFMGSFKETAPVELLRVLPGELPIDHHERKDAKPDLEALVHLPAGATGLPNDILLGLGSGSKPNRNRGVAVTLDKHGEPQGSVRVVDLTQLYAVLKLKFAKLNIEGAAVHENVLWLAQRGNGIKNTNAIVNIDLEKVVSAIKNNQLIGASAIKSVTKVDLGSTQSVSWSFTDIASLKNGNLVFTAAAETSYGTVDDGDVVGAAVGIMTPEGKVLKFSKLDPVVKLEGVHVISETNGQIELALVSDGDMAGVPAKLYRARVST
ncbi:MAG: hypothetical protein H7Z43_11775 [Clostridia bacterium]|nr:hypothetical protein [Deltaproteobacteria bacterium]